MSKTETPDIVTMLQTAINDRGKGSVWGYAGLLEDAAAEIERLRSELARTERNRDMWKGQCERQADQLTQAGAMARFYACDGHWRLNGQCDPNSSRFEGPNIAQEYLRSAGQPLPSPPGENDG